MSFRVSQESNKVTSTPRSHRPSRMSPVMSVSSIDSDEGGTQQSKPDTGSRSRLMDSSTEGHSDNMEHDNETTWGGDEAQESDEFNGADYEVLLRKIRKITWVGTRRDVMPKKPNSLYYKITHNLKSIPHIARELIEDFKENHERVIVSLIQLFMDLSAYQEVDVAGLYSFQKQNGKQILKSILDRDYDRDVQKIDRHFFFKSSHFSDRMEIVVCVFLRRLIRDTFDAQNSDGRSILTHEMFSSHVFEFIRCMAFSSIITVRVTGIFLAIKILTELTNLYSQFLTFLERNPASAGPAELDDKQVLGSYIDFFYMIFDKNCLIPNKFCYLIRAKCAREMIKWVTLFPNIFLIKRRNCILKFVKLVTDMHVFVRLAALDTCEKLVSSDIFLDEMRQKLELLVATVGGRRLDVNYQVAIKTVKVFRKMIDRYFTFIPSGIRTSIIYLIYQKNPDLAKAAGDFYVALLRKENKNGRLMLLSFALLNVSKVEFQMRKSLLVESCLEHCTELTDWDLITNTLLESSVSLNLRKSLLEIVAETVCFYLTGKYSQPRNMVHTVNEVPPANHSEVAGIFLPCLTNLFMEFNSNPKCCTSLTQIVLSIDFSLHKPTTEQCQTLLSLVFDLFHGSIDPDLLTKLAELMYNFSEKSETRKEQVRQLIDDLMQVYTRTLLEDLAKVTPGSSEQSLLHLKKYSFKVSVLFEHFDFSKNLLTWEDIFAVWDTAHFAKALRYLIQCCKWHLVWSLRHHIQTNPNLRLYSRCQEFVKNCLEILKHCQHFSATILVFETLCDFFLIFAKEIRPHREHKELLIKITEQENQSIFMKYLTHSVIESKTLTLERKQHLLVKAVDVFFLGVLPFQNFSYILAYYYSHQIEFGPIIDVALSGLKKVNNALPLIVLHTLVTIYTDIREKKGEIKPLKLLAKQLAESKELKSSEKILSKLMHGAIYFACCDGHEAFLFFTKYFLNNLSRDYKNDLYEFFKKKVPAEERNTEIYVFFSKHLKA